MLTHYRLLPEPILLGAALSISLFELALGIRCWKREAPRAWAVATAMNAGYTLLALSSLLRGLTIENCGCFGVFLARPLGWNTVAEDLALTVVCGYLHFRQRALALAPQSEGSLPTRAA